MTEERRTALGLHAGRIAEQQGWIDAALVSAASLSGEGPAGPALLVIASEPLTVEQARAVASLAGAGRHVAVISLEPPTGEVANWLPDVVITSGPWSKSDEQATGLEDAATGQLAPQPVREPALARFPVLRESSLGIELAQAAEQQGVRIHFPDEDPRCVLSMWSTARHGDCAIWVFGDPDDSDRQGGKFLVETTVGYDPDPDWVDGSSGDAPLAVYLLQLLGHAENVSSSQAMAGGAGALGFGPAEIAGMQQFLQTWAPPEGPPWPDESLLTGSLWSVLGPRRVALRAPDGTNDPPGMYPPPTEAVWVGYEVSHQEALGVPLRKAMEELATFANIALDDPVVRRRLRSTEW